MAPQDLARLFRQARKPVPDGVEIDCPRGFHRGTSLRVRAPRGQPPCPARGRTPNSHSTFRAVTARPSDAKWRPVLAAALPDGEDSAPLVTTGAERLQRARENQPGAARDVAVIETTPAVRIARPPPMVPVDSGAPAVELDIHPIALFGPQCDESFHRGTSLLQAKNREPLMTARCGEAPFRSQLAVPSSHVK